MFDRGLIVGKFYPPHRGHKYLIDTARAACSQLTVIVCWKPTETISGFQRAAWLQQIHPDVRIITLEDNKLADDDSEGWAKSTLDILGYRPDAVFTSEDYGDPYAKFLGCVHVLVDKDRVTVPISATMVRSQPMRYAEFLEPCVRAYFARRICIIGAESTGKTTLARELATHYHTVWVPEYGRYYCEGKFPAAQKDEWREDEFVYIAQMQGKAEDLLAERSNGLVIADTDPFATSVWHERYLNTISARVEKLANERKYDLYIVTGDEIDFEQDGTRDGEHIRHAMHARFIERLIETQRKFIVVRGTQEERLTKAIEAINALSK